MITNPQFKPGVMESRLNRAKKGTRTKCFYKLGRGGWNQKFPFDPAWDKNKLGQGRSDCSGFISHTLITQRAPKVGREFWIETTAIYDDATGPCTNFVRIDRPCPGAMVVYPDKNGKQGHIGIITDVRIMSDPERMLYEYDTIECASGLQGRIGKAIRKRVNAQNLFGKRESIFVCLKQDLHV